MRKHYQIFHFNGETLSDNRPCVRKYLIAGVSFENIYLYPLRMHDIYQKEDFPLLNTLHRLYGKSKNLSINNSSLNLSGANISAFRHISLFFVQYRHWISVCKNWWFCSKNIFSSLIAHKRHSSRYDCSVFPRKRDFCKFNLIWCTALTTSFILNTDSNQSDVHGGFFAFNCAEGNWKDLCLLRLQRTCIKGARGIPPRPRGRFPPMRNCWFRVWMNHSDTRKGSFCRPAIRNRKIHMGNSNTRWLQCLLERGFQVSPFNLKREKRLFTHRGY